MEYLIGVILALAVAGSATMIGLDRGRAFYPTVLIVVASYYVLFAVMGATTQVLWVEIAFASGVSLIAIIGFKRNMWIVAAALVGHGVFDFVHHLVIEDPGVPNWWPGFCLAFDLIAGAWLAMRLRSRSTDPGELDREPGGNLYLCGLGCGLPKLFVSAKGPLTRKEGTMSNFKSTRQEKRMITPRMAALVSAAWALSSFMSVTARAADGPFEYRVLATSKMSTMEKELNEAAAAGYRFSKAMGGKSANGGQEVIVAMIKDANASGQGLRAYRLLATSRTSTMQKEMQQSADDGYVYKEQTVFESAFGGREVVVIMERDTSKKNSRASYRLLATTKTSTMQKELGEAGAQGYVLLGLTVGKTEMGGDEVVAILGLE